MSASAGSPDTSRPPAWRQIERDDLAGLIASNEEIHGPLPAEEIQAAEKKLFSPAGRGTGTAEAAA